MLFQSIVTSKQIKVNSDLSQERGGVYTLNFCVELRRGKDCVNIEVEIGELKRAVSKAVPGYGGRGGWGDELVHGFTLIEGACKLSFRAFNQKKPCPWKLQHVE